MVINISEIISTTGKTENYNVPIEMSHVCVNRTDYTIAKHQPVKLVITNTGSRKIHIGGEIHVTLNIPCDRCLEDVPVDFDIEIDREIDFNHSDDDRRKALDEISYIDHSDLDVDLMVCNEILLHFPMKTLCREDCKGLCFKCGQNLNNGECGCDRESLDPRMSAIRDIFNNFKEV